MLPSWCEGLSQGRAGQGRVRQGWEGPCSPTLKASCHGLTPPTPMPLPPAARAAAAASSALLPQLLQLSVAALDRADTSHAVRCCVCSCVVLHAVLSVLLPQLSVAALGWADTSHAVRRCVCSYVVLHATPSTLLCGAAAHVAAGSLLGLGGCACMRRALSRCSSHTSPSTNGTHTHMHTHAHKHTHTPQGACAIQDVCTFCGRHLHACVDPLLALYHRVQGAWCKLCRALKVHCWLSCTQPSVRTGCNHV